MFCPQYEKKTVSFSTRFASRLTRAKSFLLPFLGKQNGNCESLDVLDKNLAAYISFVCSNLL